MRNRLLTKKNFNCSLQHSLMIVSPNPCRPKPKFIFPLIFITGRATKPPNQLPSLSFQFESPCFQIIAIVAFRTPPSKTRLKTQSIVFRLCIFKNVLRTTKQQVGLRERPLWPLCQPPAQGIPALAGRSSSPSSKKPCFCSTMPDPCERLHTTTIRDRDLRFESIWSSMY